MFSVLNGSDQGIYTSLGGLAVLVRFSDKLFTFMVLWCLDILSVRSERFSLCVCSTALVGTQMTDGVNILPQPGQPGSCHPLLWANTN